MTPLHGTLNFGVEIRVCDIIALGPERKQIVRQKQRALMNALIPA